MENTTSSVELDPEKSILEPDKKYCLHHLFIRIRPCRTIPPLQMQVVQFTRADGIYYSFSTFTPLCEFIYWHKILMCLPYFRIFRDGMILLKKSERVSNHRDKRSSCSSWKCFKMCRYIRDTSPKNYNHSGCYCRIGFEKQYGMK